MMRSIGGGPAAWMASSAAGGPAGATPTAGGAKAAAIRTEWSSPAAGWGGTAGSGLAGPFRAEQSQSVAVPELTGAGQHGRLAWSAAGRVPQHGQKAGIAVAVVLTGATGPQAHARPGGSQAASSVAAAATKLTRRNPLRERPAMLIRYSGTRRPVKADFRPGPPPGKVGPDPAAGYCDRDCVGT